MNSNYTILNRPTTVWPIEKAKQIAKHNQDHDPDWEYHIDVNPQNPNLAIIEVYDDEGVWVGNL